MCSHCYGLPLYSFHRFVQKGPFQILDYPKGGCSIFSTDFNFLIFSWFNFRILILQFDQFLSLINQKSHDNQPYSGFISQFPEDSTWFLISDLLNSISQIHQNQFQVLQILSFWSWFSNWFNQRFPVQNFQIPDSQILFLDEIQIPDFYFKSRLNSNSLWKNQSHFSRWAR